ncbi:hypothetical protein LCGC14_0469600 [marine sediment metagenome]|uniref:Uncharacterized protein n=1 Tax=marine sediment metagenome TaxID=412755 RepID=A0A0F9SCM3_9ZZZZ
MYTKKIWCCVGDEYDNLAYSIDTPCRYKGKYFPLHEAHHATKGDFEIYGGRCWSPACLSSGPIGEDFKLTLHFPPTDSGEPSSDDINVVLKAIEEVVDTEEFKSKVRRVLANDRIYVIARTNVYCGDY